MVERQDPGGAGSEVELLRLLVENVRDHAVFVTEAERRVLTWTPAGERLLGYTEAEILGRSADLFFTPEDVCAGAPRQEVAQAFAAGRVEDNRWRYLPGDFPLWEAVYQQARRWLSAGCFEAMAHDLREILGVAAGRESGPTAAVFAGRTLQSAPESGGRAGYDGHKRRKGGTSAARARRSTWPWTRWGTCWP